MPGLLLGLALSLSAGASAPADCEEQVRADPGDRLAWRCIYLQARRSGGWDAAETRLERALRDDPDNHHARLNLGHLASDRGQAAAEPRYLATIEGYAAASDPMGEVKARIALGNFLAHQGRDAAETQAQLDAAAEVAAASGDASLKATVAAQQARQLWRQGSDYAEAYRLIRTAETHAFPDGAYQLKLLVLHVLAGICRETDRLDEAYAASRRLVTLSAEAGDRYVEATARLNVADFAVSHPERVPPGTGEAASRAALDAAEAAGNPYALAGAVCVRARALDAAGVDSLETWRACATAYAELGDPLAQTLGDLGTAGALVADDPAAGAALAQGAVSRARTMGDETAEVMARFAEALLLWEAEGASAGRVAFAAHRDAVDRLRAHQADDHTAAEAAAGHAAGQHHLAERLALSAPADLDGALAAVEHLRARALVDALERRDPATAQPGTAELAAIGAQLTALNARLGEAPTDAVRDGLLRQREALEAEESALRARADHAARSDAGVTAPPSIAAVQAALAPGEVLLSFQVPPSQQIVPTLQARPWVLAISPSRVAALPLPDRAWLAAATETFSGLDHGDPAVMAPATALGAALLTPALDALGHTEASPPTRIVLVPDGPLHGLPFAALRVAASDAPVGTRIALSRAPSVTTWLGLRSTPPPDSPGPALVLGDPTWPAAGGPPLARLPGAQTEAEAVARQLGSPPLLGDAATEAAVRSVTAPPRLLHLAAHGLGGAAGDRRHALALAQGADQDGLLQAREVRDLDLLGSVVVLSACRGATGRVIEGDGLQGLSRAFLLAGAPVVVGSLWPVPDAAAGAFMRSFAQALSQGSDVDGALREARAERHAAGDDPRAWAGFVAMGDGARRLPEGPAPGTPHPGWLVLLGGAALAGMAALRRGARG